MEPAARGAGGLKLGARNREARAGGGPGPRAWETNRSYAHQGLVAASASSHARRRTLASSQSGWRGCALTFIHTPSVRPGVSTWRADRRARGQAAAPAPRAGRAYRQ